MRREARKYLADIEQAAGNVLRFAAGKDLRAYQADPLLRSAVERQLEIVGEAMSQLARVDAATAQRVTDYRDIIGLRNVLIHRYGDVDDRLVWDIVQSRVGRLRDEVARLLENSSKSGG